MRYDAVIFDLDGTLTDSQRGITGCVKYALEKMGRPVPPVQTLRRFLGPPLAESFMNYCGMNEKDAKLATEYYRERYIPTGWRENSVFIGIRPLLRELKKRGAYLAVATGKPENTSRSILRYFGLLDYFDDVAGPRPMDLHADKGELIARVLPLNKKAVMVGDSAGDIKGAQERGIESVAAFYGYDAPERMQKQNPTHIVHSVEELQMLLLGERVFDKGCFISVEGLDGCGKTTQMENARELLSDFGFPVRLSREPGGCPISESIRQIVLAQKENGLTAMAEALLFAAARAQHVAEVIKPAVERGETLLCDRFVDSSIVYQGAGRALGENVVQKINDFAVDGCMPDITIYLAIDHATSITRRINASSPDRIEQQNDAFFETVERAYNELIKKDGRRFLVVDASQPIEAVGASLKTQLAARLLERGLL